MPRTNTIPLAKTKKRAARAAPVTPQQRLAAKLSLAAAQAQAMRNAPAVRNAPPCPRMGPCAAQRFGSPLSSGLLGLLEPD